MDKITIDEATLRRNVLAFLRSPHGQPVRELFDFPFAWCLLLVLIACGFGLCMLPTIIWTLAGLKSLWYVIKLEPFEPMWNNPKHKPETLTPLICHGIIIGPDRKHALVLGTFESANNYSVDWLARTAASFGEIYARRGAGGEPAHAAIRELLHDDNYHPHRRRRIPEPYAQGKDLLLFDVELDANESRTTPYGTMLFAFVADYGEPDGKGEKGEIAAIPWAAVHDAVRINAA